MTTDTGTETKYFSLFSDLLECAESDETITGDETCFCANNCESK
jgi:hypothetical protein